MQKDTIREKWEINTYLNSFWGGRGKGKQDMYYNLSYHYQATKMEETKKAYQENQD